jgi:hypothetical protein
MEKAVLQPMNSSFLLEGDFSSITLVKLGDLEDLADPPLLGSYATPPSPQRLQNEERMQRNVEDLHGFPSEGFLRLEDSPPGIPPPDPN